MGFFDAFDPTDGGADRDRRPPKHIRGIACDVKSCAYHDGDNYCTADHIAIGPSYATSCTETVCASYKPKGLS